MVEKGSKKWFLVKIRVFRRNCENRRFLGIPEKPRFFEKKVQFLPKLFWGNYRKWPKWPKMAKKWGFKGIPLENHPKSGFSGFFDPFSDPFFQGFYSYCQKPHKTMSKIEVLKIV